MEMFIALLVIAIIVGVVIFISARDPGDLHLNIQGSPARITLDEAKQVNRVTYLQLISPELARALAGKLQRDGAEAFVKSWHQLMQRIADKAQALAGGGR